MADFAKIETDTSALRKELKDRGVKLMHLHEGQEGRVKAYKEDPNLAEVLRAVIELSELAMNDREVLDDGSLEEVG